MRVLFLTIATFPDLAHRGVYTDLLREFRNRGDDVCIACTRERRHGGQTELVNDEGAHILRVRTGNLTKTGVVGKTLSTLLVEHQFKSAIRRHLSDKRFDVVMYSTPPVTLDGVVKYVKQRYGCRSYLLLKDIFPQNAVDLDLMRKGGLAWRYFRSREKRLYSLSDRIGCMSQANVAYVLAHNPEIQPDRVEVCANSIEPLPPNHFRGRVSSIRTDLGLPEDRVVFVYGGNLGRPQGVDFILECLQRLKARSDVYFMIVGSGTEYARIERYVGESGFQDVQLRPSLPKDKYDALLSASDVGLIFLDHRFTIPNFPSRLTAYMEAGLPVLAATDQATDIRGVLEESASGVWVPSDSVDAFVSALDLLTKDPDLRRRMGDAGRAYLEEHYTVARAYDTIVAGLDGPTGESAGGNAGQDSGSL